MVDSITSALGAGSGIDIKALVDNLVNAQFSTKNAMLDTRETALKAQISAAGELKSAVSGFSNALATLARGGSLSTQPTSTDTASVRATLLAGGSASGLSATIAVNRIAASQATNSDPIAAEARFRQGIMTLTFGTVTPSGGKIGDFDATEGATSFPIDIAEGATLSDVAAAINAQKSRTGVGAVVIGDAGGSRLVLKGATGASQAFTLTTDAATRDDAGELTGLGAIEVDVGKGNLGTAAEDAEVVIDGLLVRRASNSINNLVPGVRLDLVAAGRGPVQLGSTPPSEGLSQAVQDFVSTYNQLQTMLKTATDPKGGALRSDVAARTLQTDLSRLVSTDLSGAVGSLRTLAEIGVGTLRDGTLSVNSAQLASALSRDPQAVEAMFAASAGLPAAMQRISLAAGSTRTGLGASEASYTKAADLIAQAREKALEAAETTRTRMTQQFASMDAKVAAYKSTQTFLQQQVDAWNNTGR